LPSRQLADSEIEVNFETASQRRHCRFPIDDLASGQGRFTRERSKVRSLVRPPLDLHIQPLIRTFPFESAPKKLGHDRVTLLNQGRQQSFHRAHEALRFRCQRRDLLIRYDDILLRYLCQPEIG
jgi:hypothetical protein